MQPFKQPYLCLSSQPYRIEAEDKEGRKTGEIIEGISIRYLPTNNLEPRLENDRGQDSRGIKVAKFTLPIEKRSQLNQFPGIYDVELEMMVVGDKMQVRPKNIEFVTTVKLQPNKAEKAG